ncbi:unnamed protein product [Discula destructiva]
MKVNRMLSIINSYMSIIRDRGPFKSGTLDCTHSHSLLCPSRESQHRLPQTLRANATFPEPSFTLNSVKRVSKTYEVEVKITGLEAKLRKSSPSYLRPPASHGSMHNSLPRGARAGRASWNSQDFAEPDAQVSAMQ